MCWCVMLSCRTATLEYSSPTPILADPPPPPPTMAPGVPPPPPSPCLTAAEAARSVIERSFAVVRVGPGTEAAVAGAWGAARALFSGAPTGEAGGRGGREGDEAEAEAFVREHQRTAGGDLLGYALPPGGAKALFRAACSGWGERAGQPWPSLEGEEEGGEGSSLRSSSLAAAEVMHSLLVDVLDEIRTAVREEEEEEEEWGSGGGGHPDPPRKKRPRIPDPPRYEVDVPPHVPGGDLLPPRLLLLPREGSRPYELLGARRSGGADLRRPHRRGRPGGSAPGRSRRLRRAACFRLPRAAVEGRGPAQRARGEAGAARWSASWRGTSLRRRAGGRGPAPGPGPGPGAAAPR